MSVYFYGCVTIDGFLADKNHNLDWLNDTGSIEDTGFEEFYRDVDITIMGKKTYGEIAKFSNLNEMYPTSKNYVFTHSKNLESSYIPISCDVVEFVESIEREKNIWVVGGNQVLAPLLNKNMIDKMIIQVAPVLLGDGIPLFTQEEVLKRFFLEEVNKYGQFAELVYSKI
ncbi:RibD C-terminal domain-containing protein [Anaerosphaera aminiphila DSM 21120]|uniref:RibD C-terminal domain-containing protein n=1 Tax=Anaerosphaera aminiphila DSM 21120 TaxID=1120995 RepID=A0A1M5UR37_9FIRM|nr:dihydrofolate reductase family protein [Anaerosphaera aminiphila]SHH65449.1 RibD C-terminal domain-containing protein [Anaerosphaera aminiphila DSM 21120]